MSSLTRDSGFLRALSLFASFIPGVGPGIALALNIRANEVDRRNANRAARDAYNASLLDRQQVIRSAEAPRGICYGETQISGVLAYAKEYGTNNANLAVVVSLFAGHEIQAIDEVWIGDRKVGTLDGSGNATVAPFYTSTATFEAYSVASTQNANQAVVVTNAPIIGTVTAVSDNSDSNPSVNCSIVSVVGTTVTIDSSGVTNGINITIQYRYNVNAAWVRVKKYLGLASQTHDTDVASASGGQWTVDHDGRGVVYLALFLSYNEDVFPTGLENIRARVRGKKVFDPRSSTTYYSKNPALCARDYLLDPLGFGCSAGEIDEASFIAAANVCDEVVSEPVWNGSAWVVANDHPRYQCDTFLSTASPRNENLQIVADAMAGYIVFSQGKWRAYAGAFTTPTVTLTEADLAQGEIVINSRAPRRSLFNTVRGTFADALNGYQVTDYPPVTNATYKTQDGGEELVADIPLPAVTDVVRAQRLAKIFLERHRQALTLDATFNLHAYAVTPGDIVAVTLARYGFSAKAFRVLEREFSLATGVRLTLREEAAGVYTWGSGEANVEDLAPNTVLPNPWAVAAITSLTATSGGAVPLRQADGSVVTRVSLTWPAVTDINVLQGGAIEVESLAASNRLSGEIWQRVAEAAGTDTQAFIDDARVGAYYLFRVRARNGLRVRSAYTYAALHLVQGDTVAPAAPTSLALTQVGNNVRRLTWSKAVLEPDLNDFEVRYASGGSITWSSATLLDIVPAGNPDALTWQLETLKPEFAGTYSFEVRARDTSGNVSSSGSQATAQVLGPVVIAPSMSITPDPGITSRAAWETDGQPWPDILALGNTSVPLGGNAWRGDANGEYVFTKPVPFDRTQTYLASVWAQRSASGDDRTMYITVRFYDASGTIINGTTDAAGWASASTYHYFGLTGGVPPTAWTEYTQTFGAGMTAGCPTNAKFVSIGALVAYSGTTGANLIAAPTIRQVVPTRQILPDAASQVAQTTVASHTPIAEKFFTTSTQWNNPNTAASVAITTPSDSANMDVLVEASGICKIVQDSSGSKVGPFIKLWLRDFQITDNTPAAGTSEIPDQRVQVDVATSSSAIIPFNVQRYFSVAPGTSKTYYLQTVREGFAANTATTYTVEEIRLRVFTRRR